MEGFNVPLIHTVAFPLGLPQTNHESALSLYLISTYGAQYYEECGRDRYHCNESISSSCTCLEKQVSDKNSLFDRGSIGEMGLYVKNNKSQYMGVLDWPIGGKLEGKNYGFEVGGSKLFNNSNASPSSKCYIARPAPPFFLFSLLTNTLRFL